ncbi:MAG: hypothetical protein ACI8QC_004292 [Planctomycetota bacterium]|jgi:hypothetical protein
MSSFSVTRAMGVPVDATWAALEDFGGVHRYSAGVERSPINAGTPASGVGAERVCHMYDGGFIEERVTSSVKNKRMEILIVTSSMPLKRANAAFDVVSTADGGTDVTMTMTYVMKFGPLGWLMDKLMVKRAMTRSLNGLLAALGHHLTTGEPIGKGWKPAVAA